MIYAHTDFLNYVNFFSGKKFLNLKKADIGLFFNQMLKDLRNISRDNLIIPTYNYDFGKNKIFDVFKDKSQVGSFSEFFRKKYIKTRTRVPFFSSCSLRKRKSFNINNSDVFGINSDFYSLFKERGNIVNFGSRFAPTFIIFIESNIPGGAIYRYKKRFTGVIKDKGLKKNISFDYQVRPLNVDIKYDLKKIQSDLIKNGILIKKKTAFGFPYQQYNANSFFEHSSEKLKKDPLYFLDDSTKKLIKKKKFLKKGRVKLEDFE